MNPLARSWDWLTDITFFHKAALISLMFTLVTAIAVLPLPYAVIAISGLGAVFLLLIRPEFGIWLIVFSVPYGSLKEGEAGGLDLSLAEPLAVAVVFFWFLRCVRERRMVLNVGPLFIPLIVFLSVAIFSLSTAPSLALGLKELLKWAALLAAYVFVVNNVRTRRQVAVALALILIAAISESLLGFYQFVAKAGPPGFVVGSFMRAFGTFGQPNPYAGYLAMCAVAAFGVVLFSVRARFFGLTGLQPHQRWLIMIAWSATLASFGAVVLSLSRGALLGLFAGMAIVMAVSSRRALFVMMVLLIIVALMLGLGIMQMLPSQITDRVSEAVANFGVFDVREVKLTAQNWPLVERMAMWQAAWAMYEGNPLVGVGIGNYAEAYKDYFIPPWKMPKGHAHNYYLNVLAEMGIIGLAVYLLLLLSVFVHMIKVIRQLSSSSNYQFERYVAIGLLGSLVALSVHNVFDVLFVHGIGVQIALILGLVSVLGKLVKQGDGSVTLGSV